LKRQQIRVGILRAKGTNCDLETKRAFDELKVKTKLVRSRDLSVEALSKYHILVFPGGFSHGDYVRAGVVWAKEIGIKFGRALESLVENGNPILGICNGFQVLVEMGFLPAFEGISEYPEMTLAINVSDRYECRWVSKGDFLYLKHENTNNCIFTRQIPHGSLVRIPIGHGEGRVLFPKDRGLEFYERLVKNDQLVFRFARADGTYPHGEYPYNPNGSAFDIAGICNPQGNVMGLMPHPERAFYSWQLPDYTSKDERKEYGDGRFIFESVVEYVETEF
jgi:phosphoribosylformylglycinamidine synthase